MLKKLNTLPRAKQQYIFKFQYAGKLKRYVVDGPAPYDTDEERERQATAVVRRPGSNKVKIEETDDE